MTRYGYARVSTKDQKLDRQIEALVNAGVPYGHIYKDKVTGAKDGDRTQQKRLFKKMKAVDAGFGVVRIGIVILGAYRTHFVL